jgi:glycerol-3-phosphate acyltransferase PlsY
MYYALHTDLGISAFLAAVSIVLTVRHKDNIQRLLKGEES